MKADGLQQRGGDVFIMDGLSPLEYIASLVVPPKKEKDYGETTEGVWRTIRGRRVFIKEGETPEEAIARSLRTSRARHSHKPATREKQQKAARFEKAVAKAVGGKDLDDNEPFDVIKGRQAVEVKAIIEGKNPKITMHPESLARKANYLRDNEMVGHTVVIDARSSKEIYYYARGVGSFRLSGMERVTKTRLKELIL